MIFLLFLIALSATLTPSSASADDLYRTCREKVDGNSAGWERLCRDRFDMPDPYLVKCLSWVKDRQAPTPEDILACRYYCRSNKNWGPWYDYELRPELKETFFTMRSLHRRDQCFIDICPDLSGDYAAEGTETGLKIESTVGADGYRTYVLDGTGFRATGGKIDEDGKSYRLGCTDRRIELELMGDGRSVVRNLDRLRNGDLRESGTTPRVWKRR